METRNQKKTGSYRKSIRVGQIKKTSNGTFKNRKR
jgi:hypothetical protein